MSETATQNRIPTGPRVHAHPDAKPLSDHEVGRLTGGTRLFASTGDEGKRGKYGFDADVEFVRWTDHEWAEIVVHNLYARGTFNTTAVEGKTTHCRKSELFPADVRTRLRIHREPQQLAERIEEKLETEEAERTKAA